MDFRDLEQLTLSTFPFYFEYFRTHVIGKEALKKNWKGVVEMILGQKDMDENINKIKQ